MTWVAVIALAVGTYLLKSVGPLMLGARRLPLAVQSLLALLPAALLAALVSINTFADGDSLVLDARAVGVAVAGIAALRRAPFIVVIALGTVVTALARLAGIP